MSVSSKSARDTGTASLVRSSASSGPLTSLSGLTSPSSRPLPWWDFRLLAVMAGLVAFLWAGVFHLHPPPGWVDPGLYIYWMLRPVENATIRGVDYHAVRFSFILPGALLYRLFDMVTAQALLVTFFYTVGLFAVNFIAGALLSGFTARMLAMVIVGTNALWISAFSRGYMDGACVALGLCAMACLLHPKDAPRPRHYMAAAVFLILAFSAHPVGGGIAGFTAIFVGLVRSTSLRAVMFNGAAAVVAAAVSLLVLACIAWSLGMPFFFLRALSSTVDNALDGAYEVFAVPVFQWLINAQRMTILPVMVLMLVAGTLSVRKAGRQGGAMLAAGLMPLVVLGGWWAVRSSMMMKYSFYASYLMLSLVPALVLFLHRLERIAPEQAWRRSGVLVLGLLFATSIGSLFPHGLRTDWRFAVAAWVVVGGAFLVALSLWVSRRPAPTLAALALTLALAGGLNVDTWRAYRFAGAADHAGHHTALQRLHDILNETGALRGRYHLWFGRDRFSEVRALPPQQLYDLVYGQLILQMNILDSMSSSIGWYVPAIGFTMPRADRDQSLLDISPIGRLGSEPETFIGLCADQADCEEGLAALRELGVRVAAERFSIIDVPNVPRVTVVTARITALAPLGEPGPEQLLALLQRILRADAWAGGTAFASDAARAAWQDLHWPPGPLAAVTPGTVECLPAGRLQHCLMEYTMEGASPEVRRLTLEGVGNLWLMIEASASAPSDSLAAMRAWRADTRRAVALAVGGGDRIVTWSAPIPPPMPGLFQAKHFFELASAEVRQRGDASRPVTRIPPPVNESLGSAMPRAYRDYQGWMLLTNLNNVTIRLIALCADPGECDDGMLALREVGMRLSERHDVKLEAPGMPSVMMVAASVFAPPLPAEPGLAQLSAVLERTLRLDAWEAATGQRITDFSQRALFFEPGWRSPRAQPPEVLRAECIHGPRVRDCRVFYAEEDGQMTSRAFGFQQHNNLWWNSTDIPPDR